MRIHACNHDTQEDIQQNVEMRALENRESDRSGRYDSEGGEHGERIGGGDTRDLYSDDAQSEFTDSEQQRSVRDSVSYAGRDSVREYDDLGQSEQEEEENVERREREEGQWTAHIQREQTKETRGEYDNHEVFQLCVNPEGSVFNRHVHTNSQAEHRFKHTDSTSNALTC